MGFEPTPPPRIRSLTLSYQGPVGAGPSWSTVMRVNESKIASVMHGAGWWTVYHL